LRYPQWNQSKNQLYLAGQGFTQHDMTKMRCNDGMTHTGAQLGNDTMMRHI
jgi:hypothetical protein